MPASQHLRVLFLRSGRIIAQTLLRPDARRSTLFPRQVIHMLDGDGGLWCSPFNTSSRTTLPCA